MSTAFVAPAVGSNVGRSIVDLEVSPPDGWEEELRSISPKTEHFSWLMWYWYSPVMRWVLYDCMPVALLGDEEDLLVPGFTVGDFLRVVNGPKPSERESWDFCPFVSDLQWTLYHKHKVYARPFWVLQGSNGGHQVAFSPWQKNVLATKGMPTDPPAVGSLPACPFDARVKEQLHRMNRLRQFDFNLEKMRKTGDSEGADKALAEHQKEIRLAEMDMLEKQMAELVDCARSVAQRADSRDHLLYVNPGTAGAATEALQHYKETGEFIY